ncbi:hypothetical protein ACFY2W_16265 [Streptomyces sp. NPDC001262]|uniref:hypothetical protein n=1 Tax=Streptomyces TaxID=1883 RepID=UPI0036BEFA9C
MDNRAEPWNGQSGAGPFTVIFDGKVFENKWWVEASHCPGKAQQDPNNNPWRVFRDATSEEVALGNPTNCG